MSILPVFNDKVYVYKNNIEMSRLTQNRELITKKDELIRDVGANNYNAEDGPWMSEEKFSYSGLVIYGLPMLVIFGLCIKNIEKSDIEEQHRVKKRRALYEKRWYDKWLR